jgi:hypothetical protein
LIIDSSAVMPGAKCINTQQIIVPAQPSRIRAG